MPRGGDVFVTRAERSMTFHQMFNILNGLPFKILKMKHLRKLQVAVEVAKKNYSFEKIVSFKQIVSMVR